MKYTPIDPYLFIQNRRNFEKKLHKNALAVFQSGDEFPKSADQFFPFSQNKDFFYLSGVDQKESILLLFPDCPSLEFKEILFLKPTDEHTKIWEGSKLSLEKGSEISGIAGVHWLDEFDTILQRLIQYADYIYLNTNEHNKYMHAVPYRDLRFINTMKRKYPLHEYKRAAPILRDLRSVKSDIEVDLIKKACSITHGAFERILNFVKPGVKEYEIEAEIIHEFIRNGATGHAYEPIVASGSNSNVLHYIVNEQTCGDGDVLLLDFGAEYAHYNADLTRTIPVNGRFTPRQKEVYTSVLNILKSAKNLMIPGLKLDDYQSSVTEIVIEELLKLGLLKGKEHGESDTSKYAYKKYFMHGISHHLGLDVHDVSSAYAPFVVGNVLTVEPGIYIPEEGFGIRLENNVLITDEGLVDLTEGVPIEIEEIEDMMAKRVH